MTKPTPQLLAQGLLPEEAWRAIDKLAWGLVKEIEGAEPPRDCSDVAWRAWDSLRAAALAEWYLLARWNDDEFRRQAMQSVPSAYGGAAWTPMFNNPDRYE